MLCVIYMTLELRVMWSQHSSRWSMRMHCTYKTLCSAWCHEIWSCCKVHQLPQYSPTYWSSERLRSVSETFSTISIWSRERPPRGKQSATIYLTAFLLSHLSRWDTFSSMSSVLWHLDFPSPAPTWNEPKKPRKRADTLSLSFLFLSSLSQFLVDTRTEITTNTHKYARTHTHVE